MYNAGGVLMYPNSPIMTAEEARELAETGSYVDSVERAAIGSLIRTAAKSKEFRVICQHTIQPDVLAELEAKHFTITQVNISNAPQYIISWKREV